MRSAQVRMGLICLSASLGGCVTFAEADGDDTTGMAVSACLTETRLYVPPPNPGAREQIHGLIRAGEYADAGRIAKLVSIPQAVWLTGGTPQEVRRAVKRTMARAASQRAIPVLVLYNLPFRDCAQYSAGGAIDTAAYQEWIDAVVGGIGQRKAVVLLEPDGLGIIPYNTTTYGALEWCQPTVVDDAGNVQPAPGASAEERYAQLRYAVANLREGAPNVSVYLDATHSAWLGVGEAAHRIHQAGFLDGVPQVQGFFVNVSNYQITEQATQFATWVSYCVTAGTQGVDWMRGNFGWCPGQYNPDHDFALDYSEEYAASVTASLEEMMAGAEPTLRFVIDTSRNGRGPLDAGQYAAPPYNQPESVIQALNGGSWCNPKGSGLGLRPRVFAGGEGSLLDAHLWVKIPGESDGTCDIAGGARSWDYAEYNPWEVPEAEQDHFDPLWGMVDPAAGDWFAEQALELATLAEPPLW